MPRPKLLPNRNVLEVALALMHERGPEALTFAALAEACGLAPATLVQRFGDKPALKRAALLHGWDRLDEKTAGLAATVPKTPNGAVDLLVELSREYGGIEAYTKGLLVLREDLRDPILRARGKAWKKVLSEALDACFANEPATFRNAGLLLATQWQGALLWWSFDPRERIERYVGSSLADFVSELLGRRNLGRE